MEYVLTVISSPDFVFKKAGRFVEAAFNHVHDHFIPHARNNYHPHILGHRALALFSALLVSVKIFTIAVISFGPILPAYSSAITPDNIIQLTNQSREQYSLKDLSMNSQLAQAAQAKADDMLAKGYFAHNTPDGKTPWSFITAAGYNYIMAGENLAVNFTDSESVETAWMNSPGHKANILNKNFEEIGIGISEGQYQGHTAIFVVQEFGAPAEQKIQLSDKPTVVQTGDVPSPAQTAVAPVKTAVKQTINIQSQATLKTADLNSPVPASPAPSSGPVQAPSSASQPLADLRGAPAPVNQTVIEPIKILDSQMAVQSNDTILLNVLTNASAVRVLALFGSSSVMFEAKPDNHWQASIDLNKVAVAGNAVRIKAYDMSGNVVNQQLADFSSSTVSNYSILGATTAVKVNFLGKVFDPQKAQNDFMLFFVASMLGSLILAIGIHRRIQHVSLVANTSFVVVLALMLWMAG